MVPRVGRLRKASLTGTEGARDQMGPIGRGRARGSALCARACFAQDMQSAAQTQTLNLHTQLAGLAWITRAQKPLRLRS